MIGNIASQLAGTEIGLLERTFYRLGSLYLLSRHSFYNRRLGRSYFLESCFLFIVVDPKTKQKHTRCMAARREMLVTERALALSRDEECAVEWNLEVLEARLDAVTLADCLTTAFNLQYEDKNRLLASRRIV